MSFSYLTLAAVAILVVLLLACLLVLGLQNRDLLRARAYPELLARLLPLLSTVALVAGLPVVMDLTVADNALPVLLSYLVGTAVLATISTRLVAPEERRAGSLFRREEYEGAAAIYKQLVTRRPLPRYYSALGACLDILGDHRAALEATDRAIMLDPKLGIAYLNRASTLAALGELTRARDDLQTVFRVDSNRRLRRAAGEALKSLEKG